MKYPLQILNKELDNLDRDLKTAKKFYHETGVQILSEEQFCASIVKRIKDVREAIVIIEMFSIKEDEAKS